MKVWGHASVGLIGAMMVIFGVLLIPMVTNMILVYVVKQIMLVCPCSQLYPAWKEPSNNVPLYQSFYFLEIQNPDQALKGAKPIMKEVGPYTYNLTMYRNAKEWNLNNTVTYTQPIWYEFVRSHSVGSDEDVITTINFPFVAAANSVKYNSTFLKMMISSIAVTTKTTLFKRLKIKEILWGYYDPFLNESQKFAGKKLIPDDHFGFLMGRNGTTNGLYNSFTGVDDYRKVAKIEYWNNTNSLNWWCSEEANMINGTDGTMFHPFIDKSEVLYLFNPDTCRSLPYIYKEDTSYLGIPLHHYYVPPYVYANSTMYPPNEEFCQKHSRFSGVFNTSACSRGAPMGLSNPHFLYGSKDLQESIDGLNPNVSLHESFFQIEPIMGMPYIFAERLQINLFVESIPHITGTGNVRSFYYPFLWFEEKVIVKMEDAMKYKDNILKINTIVFNLKIVLSIIGGALILLAIVFISKKVVSPVRRDRDELKNATREPVKDVPGSTLIVNDNQTYQNRDSDETSPLLHTA
ncbi:Scavenger receptor class B member 1 [Holothuria leucospilota]|uniref:Scavenger receptor class B member 1 n=1 Tax=Holothuria leucospilota TaxID=206669 RepID=A0A9Q1CJC5_HOLLE|nr:Scavenger receptor class B member 1 [Holothuria leucospilota]